MSDLSFECLFCKQAIEPTAIDPCAVVLIANWEERNGPSHEQQFWCHGSCFQERAKAVPYIDVLHEDDD